MGYVVLLARAVVTHEDASWDPLTLFYSGDEKKATREAWEALVQDELRALLDIISKPLGSKPPRSMLDSDSDDFAYPSTFSQLVSDQETDAAAYAGYVNNLITPEFPEFGDEADGEEEAVVAADDDNVAPAYGTRGPFAAQTAYDTDMPDFPVLDAWRIAPADGAAKMDTAQDAEGDEEEECRQQAGPAGGDGGVLGYGSDVTTDSDSEDEQAAAAAGSAGDAAGGDAAGVTAPAVPVVAGDSTDSEEDDGQQDQVCCAMVEAKGV